MAVKPALGLLLVSGCSAEVAAVELCPRAAMAVVAIEGLREAKPTPQEPLRREWRPVRGKVTPEIQRTAERLLRLPYGAERIVAVGDREYKFVVERHYHAPGTRPPEGWHKGVTVYDDR
jgi:hypothetical protein